MIIEGKTKNGSQVIFRVSDVLETIPEDETRTPPFILIAHIATNAREQYYTAFTLEGLEELINTLQSRVIVMRRYESS